MVEMDGSVVVGGWDGGVGRVIVFELRNVTVIPRNRSRKHWML